MHHSEEKSASLAVPLIAILLSMAGILAALATLDGHPRHSGRVWVPPQVFEQEAGK
jgi:hypothetical protein